jgi:hypothetical protein
MAFYFRAFPTINYRVPGTNNSIPVLDISRRFTLTDILKNLRTAFDEYYVQDGERPDIIANEYYGDTTLDWLVLLTNEIHDPYFNWPLGYEQFNEYIRQKYGSVEYAMSTNHHYEQIIQKHNIVVDGGFNQRIIPEKTLVIDYTTYVSLPDTDRKQVSIYEHENNLNEANRNIFLLDPNFVQVIKEKHPYIFSEGNSTR